MYEFSNSVRSQEKKYANSVLLRPFYEDSFRVFIISLIPKLPICHLYLGSLFGWILYLSVPESVYYLSTKYGLDHFYNLFYFRIELVLKSTHYLAVSSHFQWQDLTRWILNNWPAICGSPRSFWYFFGRILKYWRFEFFVVKNFSGKRHHRVFTWQFCTFLTATQMERSQSNILFQ